MILANKIYSPLEMAEAAVIAKESEIVLLERLKLIKVNPMVVLQVLKSMEEVSEAIQQNYAYANVITETEGKTLAYDDQSVDLIFANLFLPWQKDFALILREWRRLLRPTGLLILSAFGPDTLKEYRSQMNNHDMPQFVDMHQLGDDLLAEGFSDPVLEAAHYVLTYKNQQKLIQELLMTKMWWPQNKLAIDNILIPKTNKCNEWEVTYEMIFAHAFSTPLNQSTDDGITKIPFDYLRQQLKAK